MTVALKKVFTRLGRLSDREQNAIAEILSKELTWSKSFRESQSQLSSLAAEAITEFKSGKTQPLNLK